MPTSLCSFSLCPPPPPPVHVIPDFMFSKAHNPIYSTTPPFPTLLPCIKPGTVTSLFTSTGDWKCCTALWCILILFVWPLGCRYSVIVGWIESNCLQIRLSSGRSYHTNAYLIDTYTLCLCRCSQTKSFGGLRSRHRNLWHRLWFPRIVQFSRFERRQLLFKS